MIEALAQAIGIRGGSFVDAELGEPAKLEVLRDRCLAVAGAASPAQWHEVSSPCATVAVLVSAPLAEPLRTFVDLVAARSNGEIARSQPNIAPDLVTALEEAREGAERVRRIVHDLRLFSRPQEAPPVPVDVERVIESALSIANNEIRQRARLERKFGHLPPVDANEARLGQVILSLVVNALESLPEGAPQR